MCSAQRSNWHIRSTQVVPSTGLHMAGAAGDCANSIYEGSCRKQHGLAGRLQPPCPSCPCPQCAEATQGTPEALREVTTKCPQAGTALTPRCTSVVTIWQTGISSLQHNEFWRYYFIFLNIKVTTTDQLGRELLGLLKKKKRQHFLLECKVAKQPCLALRYSSYYFPYLNKYFSFYLLCSSMT